MNDTTVYGCPTPIAWPIPARRPILVALSHGLDTLDSNAANVYLLITQRFSGTIPILLETDVTRNRETWSLKSAARHLVRLFFCLASIIISPRFFPLGDTASKAIPVNAIPSTSQMVISYQ